MLQLQQIGSQLNNCKEAIVNVISVVVGIC
jgi:hypothetical protein